MLLNQELESFIYPAVYNLDLYVCEFGQARHHALLPGPYWGSPAGFDVMLSALNDFLSHGDLDIELLYDGRLSDNGIVSRYAVSHHTNNTSQPLDLSEMIPPEKRAYSITLICHPGTFALNLDNLVTSVKPDGIEKVLFLCRQGAEL